MSHRRIHTDHAPAALGPYSQAVALPPGDHELIFTAGQIGLAPETGEIVQGGIEPQVEQVMQNLQAVLEEAGSSFSRVLKTTIFLASMDDFATVNDVYGRYVGEIPPARSTVAVRTLPKNVAVEIELIAYR